MKKLMLVVLVLLLVAGNASAAVFLDDFTSNTLGEYQMGYAMNWLGGTTMDNTAVWDGVSSVNVSTDNADEYTTLMHSTYQRPAGSEISMDIAGLSDSGANPPYDGTDRRLNDIYPGSLASFRQEYPIGVIISDTLIDTSVGAYSFADFKGYVYQHNGYASYFSAFRYEGGGNRTNLGNFNSSHAISSTFSGQTITIKANGGNFEFWADGPEFTGGPELLLTDSSAGKLVDADLKYIGILWGSFNDAAASDPDGFPPVIYESGWNNLPIGKLEVIPEPATLALLGLGALVAIRKRSKK